jgi:hypothetical protein
MTDTLLVITGMGIPLYSGRFLKASLKPVKEAAQIRRTVNGDAVDLSFAQFRKYNLKISFNDAESPALDTIWPGRQVTVQWPAELVYPTGQTGAPGRAVVSGTSVSDGNGFVHYRPQFTVLVQDYSTDFDEWGHEYVSALELVEV